MRRKKPVTINLDPEVVEKARKLGLNISRICENALREAITRLETPKTNPNTETNGGFSFSEGSLLAKEKEKWTGRDLNPRPPPCEGGICTGDSSHSHHSYQTELPALTISLPLPAMVISIFVYQFLKCFVVAIDDEVRVFEKIIKTGGEIMNI